MTETMMMLMQYGRKFAPNGEWMNCDFTLRDDMRKLAEDNLVTLNDSEDRWRLHQSQIVKHAFTIPVLEVTHQAVNEIDRVETYLDFDQIQKLIDQVVIAIEDDQTEDLVTLALELGLVFDENN